MHMLAIPYAHFESGAHHKQGYYGTSSNIKWAWFRSKALAFAFGGLGKCSPNCKADLPTDPL